MNAVAARFCADVDNRIAHPRRSPVENLILSHQSERECIHKRVLRIAIAELDLAADGRHAKRVSIVSDAFDDAPHNRAISGRDCRLVSGRGIGNAQRSEVKRIHRSNRAGAHRKNIA